MCQVLAEVQGSNKAVPFDQIDKVSLGLRGFLCDWC